MPLNPRKSDENQLTDSLGKTLAPVEIMESFWRLVAPIRMRRELPERIESCADEFAPARLGGTNPDLVFYRGKKPIFYVEAKLGSGTDCLQLTRARSWMRAHGAQDDQTILLSNFVDHIPAEVGWNGPAVPVRSATWHEIEQGLKKDYDQWSRPSQQLFARFSSLLREKSTGSRIKMKEGMVFPARHRYGEVMQRFIATGRYTKSDLLYGASIDPRICFGRPEWDVTLGTRDVERMELHYGPGRMGDGENYRAEFHLWHKSDLAYSREHIAQNWNRWRQAILADKSLKFIYGSRQGNNRMSPSEPPVECPNAWVGLIRRPGSKIFEKEIRHFSIDQTVERIAAMIKPLEQVVTNVCGR